jgi:hypothetical protein
MNTPTIKVETEALSVAESKRLVELEGRIQRGFATFIEVGEALMEIRDSRLYRSEYVTFEDYCRKQWKMSRPRVYQLIGATKVTTRLSTMVDKTPTFERQVRPLTKLPVDEQPAIWNRAVEIAEGKQPTAKQVEQAVIEKVRDRDDKAPQEVLAGGRKRRRQRELVRRRYRELSRAWDWAIDVQRKWLLKAILREPTYGNWLPKELSKINDKDTAPDAVEPAGADPVRYIFEELRKDVLLCNRDLMTKLIIRFVTDDHNEIDDDHARILLRPCPSYYDSPLTILRKLYGENNDKQIVERLLGLCAIES